MPIDILVSRLDGTSPDGDGGEPIRLEAGTTGKRCAVNLPGLHTASWSTPLDDAIADFLLEGKALVKAYEVLHDGTRLLRTHGRLLTAVERGKEGIVLCSAVGPRWRLGARLIGKSNEGYKRGDVLAQVDKGEIAAELLNAINADQDTGVMLGTVTASSDTYVGPWHYRPLEACLTDLTQGVGSPELRMEPIEFDQGKIARLDVGPTLGEQRPEAVFEFGRGERNVDDYTRTVTNEGRAGRVFHLPPGFPDTAALGVRMKENPAAVAEELLEAVVQGDLSVDELRDKLLDYHLQMRAGVRQTIAINPVTDLAGSVPILGTRDDVTAGRAAYAVGDLVPFRAWRHVDGEWKLRFDGWVRVYQVELVSNELGVITPTITVAPA